MTLNQFIFYIVLSAIFNFGDIVFSQEIKILPLGNSITWGTNQTPDSNEAVNASYRYKLHQLLIEAGYDIDFIGSRSSGYNLFNDAQHCGIPGARGAHIESILKTGYNSQPLFNVYETNGPYLNFFPPDVILFELGTNDVAANNVTDLTDYNDIFNEIDKYENNSGKPVLVFIAKIISSKNASGDCNLNSRINTFNSNLETIVNQRINNGDKLVLFDLQCDAGIDYNTDMLDTYHPNNIAYDKIGQAFFDVIHNYNSKPVLLNIPDQIIDEGSTFAVINLDNYVNDNEDNDEYIDWTFSESDCLNIILNNRIVTITPKNSEWNGAEKITFKATDRGKVIQALKKSDSVSVIFTVNPVNDPPEVLSQRKSLSALEGENISLQINYFEVIDPDNDTNDLSLKILPGTNYTFTGLNVKPDNNFRGNLEVNVAVTDGKAQSSIFIAHIFIVAVNKPPFFIFPLNRQAYVNKEYNEIIELQDPDNNDKLKIVPVNIPYWLTYDSAGNILKGIPAISDTGINEILVRGSDGSVNVDSAFNILVKPGTSKLSDDETGNLIIFPSQVKDDLNILLENYSGPCQIKIFDLQGLLVFEQEIFFSSGIEILNITELNSGFFVFKISINNKVFSGKFVKE